MSDPDFTLYRDYVQDILDASAHLVPLAGFYDRQLPEEVAEYDRWKIPTRSWKDRIQCNADVRARIRDRHWFGLIPASLGLVVLDVDDGDEDELERYLEGAGYRLERVRTRRGWHVYLKAGADWPTGNWKWSVAGCAGDIRYDAGYVVVWDPAALIRCMEWVGGGAVGLALAQAAGHKSGGGKETLPLFDAASDGIEPGRYPAGKRDAVLLDDLLKLAWGGRDSEAAVDQYRQAWLSAPDPKAGENRLAIFEDKLTRAREHVASERAQKAAAGVFEVKNAETLRDVLSRLGIAWAFNVRSGSFEYKDGGLVMDSALADGVVADIIERMADGYKVERPQGGTIPLRFAWAQFEQYMKALAARHSGNHVIDDFELWLERGLPVWDGKPRVEDLLIRLFGCEDNGLTRWAGRYLFLAPIQRADQPGCKLDELPVLIGKQGWGKSALLANLFPLQYRKTWFSDSLDMTGSVKEKIEATQGAVLVEIAEMAGVGRDWQKQKAYLTVTHDKARLSYDRVASVIPRRFAFAATADRRESLPNDPAGNRRFVAVELKHGANVELELDKTGLQMWAESKLMYRRDKELLRGRAANLPRDLMLEQADANDKFRYRDDEIEDAVAGLVGDALSHAAVLEQAGLPKYLNNRQSVRLKTALESAGWYKGYHRSGVKAGRVWRKAEEKLLV